MSNQQYPAPVAPQGGFHQMTALDFPTIISSFGDNKITTFSEDIVQFPKKKNDYTAICRVTIHAGEKTISSIAASDPASAQTHNVASIVNHATCLSVCKATQIACGLSGTCGVTSSAHIVDVTDQSASAPKKDKRKLNGGGRKPASPSQKLLIQRLCEEHGYDVNAMCQQITNVELSNLNGEQANQVIQHFMARK